MDPSANQGNLMFAFNNPYFCDGVLRIEIMSAPVESIPDYEVSDSVPNKKCRRDNLEKGNGHEAQVKELRICSTTLASRSLFFCKLFSNDGMKESQQRVVTLRIDASEEDDLMELLKFMYGKRLNASSAPELLGMLIIADKFVVTSCVEYCSLALQKLPMTLKTALLYLELPPSVSMGEAVQPLIDATNKYVAEHFKDIAKSREELMVMPLPAIEVVLGSNGLQVKSEDFLYDAILEWARKNYPNLEERRDILTKRLARYISFPYMTSQKLKEVRACPDFHHEEVCKLVFDALFLQVEGKAVCDSKELSADCSLIQRVYTFLRVKVVRFGLSRPRCTVYLALKKEECRDLFKRRLLLSEPFCVGGRWLSLVPWCRYEVQGSTYHYFGLFLLMRKGSGSCTVDYAFKVLKKPSEKFECEHRDDSCSLVEGKTLGKGNLFGIPWAYFMADDSRYFIDGILHLRVDLTIDDAPPK